MRSFPASTRDVRVIDPPLPFGAHYRSLVDYRSEVCQVVVAVLVLTDKCAVRETESAMVIVEGERGMIHV